VLRLFVSLFFGRSCCQPPRTGPPFAFPVIFPLFIPLNLNPSGPPPHLLTGFFYFLPFIPLVNCLFPSSEYPSQSQYLSSQTVLNLVTAELSSMKTRAFPPSNLPGLSNYRGSLTFPGPTLHPGAAFFKSK